MMINPSELFSLLSDETRLRCVALLQEEASLCVCEISQIIGSIQPKVSRHLALMRSSGLVLDERRGQWVYYRLNPSLPDWTSKIIKSATESLRDIEPYCSDLGKMRSLKQQNICTNKTFKIPSKN